ncbi:MAG: DUF551 domain-containing protein [Oscillospiraceae bacterium]|nr:DUF551 domain-containing protein [Oscillospiraceae bacterium]
MTREDLLKKIDFEKSWLYECGIFGSDVDIAFHAIKNSVIEALEQEPNWIPCSKKKPDEGGEYLLWGKIDENEEEDYCFIGDYHEFDETFGTEISHYDPKTLGFIDAEIEEYYSVVAWMPLPEPYKAESEEEE